MQLGQVVEKDELEHLRKIFDRFDIDGNGTISFDELAKAMRMLGLHPKKEQITAIMQEYDLDGDGVIDFGQYKQIYLARRPLPTEEQIRGAFQQLDYNDKGGIDADNILVASTRMGIEISPEDAKRMVKELDQDRDGMLNWEQFKQAIFQ